MKKLLIGFLAVGLIMGFAMTASAQPNVKASGTLYMYGSYADNELLTKDANARANIGNRLRMQFEIQVQEGLKLTTRFDALERAWGENQVVGGSQTGERNIAWERAYVTFNALYGVFDVGYQQSRAWGTCAFCDDSWLRLRNPLPLHDGPLDPRSGVGEERRLERDEGCRPEFTDYDHW